MCIRDSYYSAYYFGNTATDTGYFKGGIAYETLSSTFGRGDMHFLQNSDANSSNANITNSVMTILNNGLIGINTASPDEKIHVHGGSNIARLKLSGGALAQSYGGFVESEGVSGLGGQLRLGVIDNGVYWKGIEILEQSNQIKINTAGSEAMRIESDGTIRAKTGSFVVDTAGQGIYIGCLLYTSPSPRDRTRSRMPSSA